MFCVERISVRPTFSLFYFVFKYKVVSVKLDNGVSSAHIYTNISKKLYSLI